MHVGLRWTAASGRSEGGATLDQLQLGCDPTKNGRCDPSKNGRCDATKNERLDENTNGTLDPMDGLEGDVVAKNGDPSVRSGTVGTGYGSLGISPFLSNDPTQQKTSML